MALGRYPLDMANVRSIRIFMAVAESESFTATAKQLHMGVSTVSKNIAALEDSLESPLFYRSTRRVSITKAGEHFYQRCRAIMAEIHKASADYESNHHHPRGHLRVVGSPSFSAEVLSPLVPIFLKQYPDITMDLIVSSAMPDFIRDGIDVAIMLRNQLETTMTFLELAPNERAFCASPDYLKENGVPTVPQELEHHTCLVSLLSGVQEPWMIRDGKKVRTLQIDSSFGSNDGNVLKNLCLDGFGIANLYKFHAHEELKKGELIEIFSNSQPNLNKIFAILPHKEMIEARTKTFIEFIQDKIGAPPYWENAASDRI